MKKIVSAILSIAVMCSSANLLSAPVTALEAATYFEFQEQYNSDIFPDPDAAYTEVTEDNLVFHVYDEYAVLAECTDRTITEIVIPEDIQGVPVVGVTQTPFGFCRNLTSITLPDTFQYMNWNSLTSTTVVNLTSTNVSANNVSVNLSPTPAAETTTKSSSESETPIPSVAEIIVSENNPYYTVSEGLVYTKDMKTLVGCPPAMDIKELAISEQTERIGDYAFIECYNLEKAVIPSNIKHINNGAFTACFNLKSVEIPESITTLYGDVFYLCESLSEVVFKGELKTIGYGAFNGCNALADFTIPETVTYIGSNAFENAACVVDENGIYYVDNWVVGSDSEITRADIKNGTVGIAEMSFILRSHLKYIDVPESVKYTGALMFVSSGDASEIHYRGSAIGDQSLSAAKSAKDIYIYNPECDIFDSEKTLPAQYKYTVTIESEDSLPQTEKISGDVVIYGYENSTAQAYAEKYNRQFVVIGSNEIQGDVNADGEFNIADVVMIQDYILNKGTLTNWKAGDFCDDNVIDSYDLTLMKNKLADVAFI